MGFGNPVTFTVTVSAVAPGSGVPTGMVVLYDTSSPNAPSLEQRTVLASQSLINGVATFTVSSFTHGEHILLAIYAGDEHFNASTSAIYV